MVQAIAFLINDGKQFAGLSGIRVSRTQQAGYCSFHRSQGSAKVMRNGIKQCGFQPFALPFCLSLTELFDSTRAFNGDANQGSQSLQRLTRELRARNRQAANGADPQSHGNEILTLHSVRSHFVMQKAIFVFSSSIWAAPKPER